MRSSCVAFCLLAISLSSSSLASSIAPRNGHISYPSGQLQDVESDSNYPSQGSDETPSVASSKTTSAPAPWSGSAKNDTVPSKPQTGAAGKQPTSEYPAEGSGPDTDKDATPANSSPASANGEQKPNTTAPWSSAPGENPSQNTSAPGPVSLANSNPSSNNATYPSSDNSTSSDSYPSDGNLTTSGNPAGSGPSGPGDNQTSPNPSAGSCTMQCSSYLDANTSHAACGPEGTPNICTGGCTGAIVAQLCQLNETSPNTTQTCTNAYRESSATVHVCINEAGAFSCRGPTTGSVSCNGCPSGLGGSTPGSPTSEGSASGNGSTSETPGGDNGNSASAFPSSFNAVLASAFTLVGGFLLL